MTLVSKLDRGAREQEIARMIGGAEVTPPVLASARDLLQTRSRSEVKAKAKRKSIHGESEAWRVSIGLEHSGAR